MLDLFAAWVGPRRVVVVADIAYCNDTVTNGLPDTVVLVGAIRPDAVLTGVPLLRQGKQKAGRPRRRGAVLPKPLQLAEDPRHPWTTCSANLYGHRRTLRYKSLCAQWYRGCGTRLLRIVVVKLDHGSIRLRVFLSMDPSMRPVEILETYAERWSIEVCFRDLKQSLGFADSSARKRAAVERTAPFVAMLYSVLVAWFAEAAWRSPVAAPPLRPWYPHKRGLAFPDVLRAAQRVLGAADILDSNGVLGNLLKSAGTPRRGREPQHQRAA